MKTFKKYFLEQTEDSVAFLPGGFKPPTKGHFNALAYILQDAKRGIVYIGNKPRNNVTPEMSKAIWDIYSKYLPKPIEAIISEQSPVRSVYEFAINNPNIDLYVGAGSKDSNDTRFEFFNKKREQYPLVNIIQIPMQSGGISGTTTRQKLQDDIDDALDYFLPDTVKSNSKDVLQIKNILLNK